MPMFSNAIAYVLAIAFVGWLVWGLKPRFNRWLKRTKNPEVSLISTSENVDRARQKEELDLLIKPLYWAFKKYPDDPLDKNHPFEGLPLLLSLVTVDVKSEYHKSRGADEMDKVLDALRNLDLAQPQLKKLITEYFEIIEKRKKNNPYDQRGFEETHKTVKQIEALVKARYNELIGNDSSDKKEELENLIKPLYWKFDKYPSRNGQSSSLIHQLSSPQELWNTPVSKTSNLKELVETANSAIDIMQQHRELAQPQLRDTIDRYLEIIRIHKEEKAPYGKYSEIRYYSDAEKVLKELDNLIKARYKELTNKK